MGNIEFYTIYWWMRDELKLSDTELHCYAVIYCLSQSDNRYIAGVKRLMELLHKSKPTIIAALNGLTNKELVKKEPVIINNVTHYYYKAIRPGLNNLTTGLNDLTTNRLNNLTHNINSNIKENKKESNDSKKEDELFNIFWSKYHKGSKKAAFDKWSKLKDKEKAEVISTVDDYLTYCRRSNRPLKDCSAYLFQKCFNDDWKIIPPYYTINENDDDRHIKFKEWMWNEFPDLIYHRNPLTFEQACDLFDTYTITSVKKAMKLLCSIDIHQYFNIKSGIEKILESDEYDV